LQTGRSKNSIRSSGCISRAPRRDASDASAGAKWPLDRLLALIPNSRVLGDWGGQLGLDDAVFQVRMEIDDVRICQQ
jgi:hypothetical protein